MPAVGIVLFLIGLWLLVRTLRGKLPATLSRSSEWAGASSEPVIPDAATPAAPAAPARSPSSIARAPSPAARRRPSLHLSPSGLAHGA